MAFSEHFDILVRQRLVKLAVFVHVRGAAAATRAGRRQPVLLHHAVPPLPDVVLVVRVVKPVARLEVQPLLVIRNVVDEGARLAASAHRPRALQAAPPLLHIHQSCTSAVKAVRCHTRACDARLHLLMLREGRSLERRPELGVEDVPGRPTTSPAL